MDPDSAPNLLLIYFFPIINVFLRNMICFIIYGVNISLIVLKKMHDILMNLDDFCGIFFHDFG